MALMRTHDGTLLNHQFVVNLGSDNMPQRIGREGFKSSFRADFVVADSSL